MNDGYTMLEAVVEHENAKEIFKAFCDEPKALDCAISPHPVESECDAIVCGFNSAKKRQVVVGKMERLFPGKISWR